MLTCQHCGKEYNLNDSINPKDGTRAAGITYRKDRPTQYHNVWCPYCQAEQKKETLQ